MSLLEIKGLRVSYGKALILDGINMNVGQGELVGVIGPNGADEIMAKPVEAARLKDALERFFSS